MRKLNLRVSKPLRVFLIMSFCGVVVIFVAVSIRRKIKAMEEPFNERAFDAQVWRAADTREQIAQRARMVGSLQRTLCTGMTETQVKMVLGRPDFEDDTVPYVPPFQSKSVHKLFQYDMGTAPLDMAGQHFLLRLYFDSRQHYRFSEIARD